MASDHWLKVIYVQIYFYLENVAEELYPYMGTKKTIYTTTI